MTPPNKIQLWRALFRPLFICPLFIVYMITTSHVHAEQKDYTEKDFSHWLNAAYIAQATYESTNELPDLLDKHGYTQTQSQEIKGYAISYTFATNDETKRHILAVRGTANVENVMVDVAFVLIPDVLSGIDIHQGFLLSSQGIYQQVKPVIKPGYKIDTIGHSLGGAAALILAMMLDAQGYPVDKVITFGQPKVTNITGSRKFEHLNITRLVTDKDLVPLVPPVDPMDLMKLSIFWHQGTEIVLYPDNRYSVLTGISSMRRVTDFLNEIPSQQHLNNHYMSTYVQYIKAKLESPEEVEYKSDFSFSDWFGKYSTILACVFDEGRVAQYFNNVSLTTPFLLAGPSIQPYVLSVRRC